MTSNSDTAASQGFAAAFDVDRIRADFPLLAQTVKGQPLVYLDNAATTQKPRQVIDALVQFYSRDNSNVHRAGHELGDRATVQFEAARTGLAEFINAEQPEELIWTSGTTEAANLVAHCYGDANLILL